MIYLFNFIYVSLTEFSVVCNGVLTHSCLPIPTVFSIGSTLFGTAALPPAGGEGGRTGSGVARDVLVVHVRRPPAAGHRLLAVRRRLVVTAGGPVWKQYKEKVRGTDNVLG